MRRISLLILIFFGVASTATAQSMDSLGIRPAKPLPSSILSELRRGERNRTLVFHDTVKASDIERQHAADTSATGTFADSAITLMDTAVSLSHKEWLDSALVEIPELHRVGARVHYEYPPSIMTESEMSKVAFDSTILLRMNPVSREQLPFFDQSPIPMPLPLPKLFEAFVEVGAGNIDQPLFKGFVQQKFSPSMAFRAAGGYESRPSQPIPSYFNINGDLLASLGEDPALHPNANAELGAFVNYATRGIKLFSDSAKTRSMSLFGIGANLNGTSSSTTYGVTASLREWTEDLFRNFSESTQDAAFKISTDAGSNYSLTAAGRFSGAGTIDSGSQEADRIAVSFGSRQSSVLCWNVGLAMLGGTDAGHSIAPIANARYALNPRWELGASFDPQASLSSMTTLTATNPFYRFRSGRGAVIDKLNLVGYMTYVLSADDHLRAEVRYITRDHEPVFRSALLSDSTITQIALPTSTHHLEITGGGNFLLFARDVLTASLTIASATDVDSNRTLAYDPSMRFEATYRFNSIAEDIQPLIRARMIQLPDHTLNMIDVEVNAKIWQTASATLALDNILNGRSDYWQGYEESARRIAISLRYGF